MHVVAVVVEGLRCECRWVKVRVVGRGKWLEVRAGACRSDRALREGSWLVELEGQGDQGLHW